MAKTDLGKKFETAFKQSWLKSFPGTFVFRLADQLSGFKETSGNPCDFLCFPGHNSLYMVECKEHKGLSIPFAAIPQYERLLNYKDIPNVYPGVTIWFSEKDTVVWVSIQEMEKMYTAGEKSIGLRMLDDPAYKIVVIPSEKKRVFMESNYAVLVEENK